MHEKNVTVQDQLNDYEIAQETIGFMMGIRTEAIYQEKGKAQPDVAKIAQLEAEFIQLNNELDDLRLDDRRGIQRVLDEYCPIVKDYYERNRVAA